MNDDPIRFRIEEMDDGRVCARSADDAIEAFGEHIDDLHEKVAQAVQAVYGERRRITLLVTRARL
jgi:hypothetical protein